MLFRSREGVGPATGIDVGVSITVVCTVTVLKVVGVSDFVSLLVSSVISNTTE